MKEAGVILVSGQVIGFQFNMKSQGRRTFHRQVRIQADGTGLVKIGIGRDICVRRLGERSRFWEAF